MTRLITHNGVFHEDDVFAASVLLLCFPDAEIIRTRDPELISGNTEGDIVFDVGGSYDGKTRFDHHQDASPVRPDKILYSSAGLVWNTFGVRALKQAFGISDADLNAVENGVWRSLVDPIDHMDNGVVFQKFSTYTIQNVKAFLPSWKHDGDEDILMSRFREAVAYMTQLIRVEVRRSEKLSDNKDAEAIIDRDISRSMKDSLLDALGLVEMECWLPAMKKLCDTDREFVIFPNADKTKWTLRCIPKSLKTFESRTPLPERFAGMDRDQLRKATGMADAEFFHKGRFLFVAGSRESCVDFIERFM